MDSLLRKFDPGSRHSLFSPLFLPDPDQLERRADQVGPKEEADFASFRVRTLVDGDVKQDGSVADMLFSVETIVAYITAVMTLEPGDLIATGTPPGVGAIQPGSRVTVEIPGIGVLQNAVIAES